jgi:hypothetical protein
LGSFFLLFFKNEDDLIEQRFFLVFQFNSLLSPIMTSSFLTRRVARTLFEQLFSENSVFIHAIVQAICFKMPVERLKSCQTNDCPMLLPSLSFSQSICKKKLLLKPFTAKILL